MSQKYAPALKAYKVNVKAKGGERVSGLKKFTQSKAFMPLVWTGIIVGVWELFAFIVENTKRTPVNVLPHIWGIIESMLSTETVNGTQTALQMVLENAAATLSRAGIGFAVGVGIGFSLALLMNLSGIVEKIAFPYLMLIQMIPVLGMAPIILALTGDIGVSRIVIAAILTFYPVATNTLAGFKAVSKEKRELMYSYAANTFQIYLKTFIPGCLPYFFTGLKIAAPMAITASILVDTLQGGVGLGCLLSQSLKGAMTRYVFWQIIVLSAVIGVLSFVIIAKVEKAVCPYNQKAGE